MMRDENKRTLTPAEAVRIARHLDEWRASKRRVGK